MLRIAYHTLYKISHIMYYITWHKVFHRFANKNYNFLSLKFMRVAMKKCCPLLLAIVLFFGYFSCATLTVFAAKPNVPTGYVEIMYKWETSTITTVRGKPSDYISQYRVNSHISMSNPYSQLLKLVNSANFYNSSVYLRYGVVHREFMGRHRLPSGGWSDWVSSQSAPNWTVSASDNVQFSTEAHPSSLPWSTLSSTQAYIEYTYPAYNSADNFRASTMAQDYFNILGDFKLSGGTLWGFSVYEVRNFVDLYFSVYVPIDDQILSTIKEIHDDLLFVQTGLSTVNMNLLTINSSIKQSTTTIVNTIQTLNTTVESGFADVQQGIKDQTDAITQNNDQNTQKILDQNEQFRQEDTDRAESVGQIAQEFLDTNTEKVKSNFSILWEPIAFTQRVASVFTGGTKSLSYARRYDGVVGFVYNEKTGCLDPVIDIGPRARYGRASGGTSITFPAYTLPVLNLKLWDSYTFDVATIKTAFPALFNAIYVFSGILCLYWFLGFLSQKFEEVFKE